MLDIVTHVQRCNANSVHKITTTHLFFIGKIENVFENNLNFKGNFLYL